VVVPPRVIVLEIRPYSPEDKSEIERIHRTQGFDYTLPDLDQPLFFIKLVGEEDGRIINAAFAHLTAEIYYMAEPTTGTPRQRMGNFLAMEDLFCKVAYVKGGLSDLHAWLPPQIEKAFGRRLMRLGWRRPLWTDFCKDLQG